MENNLRGGYCMNKLRKKLITETETIEAYQYECNSTCLYNCSAPCSAHAYASVEARESSAWYQVAIL